MTSATAAFTELQLQNATLGWLGSLGWNVARSPVMAPCAPVSERTDYSEVILEQPLRDALGQPNPTVPAEALSSPW